MDKRAYWYIFKFDFEPAVRGIGCPIAIHESVVSTAWMRCSPQNVCKVPPEDALQFGPGTCPTNMDSMHALYIGVNHICCLVDAGYIDGTKAHLIFQRTHTPMMVRNLVPCNPYILCAECQASHHEDEPHTCVDLDDDGIEMPRDLPYPEAGLPGDER